MQHRWCGSNTGARRPALRSNCYNPQGAPAQQPAFLYSLTPVASPGSAPERLEPRLAAQIPLGPRFTLVAGGGFAPQDPSVRARASGAVELLANVVPAGSRGFATFGLGGMLDYTGSAVALGRVTAGLRGPQWEVAGNLRLERSLNRRLAAASARRDALDVITSVGVSRRFGRGGPLRVGLEAVGEDLEGPSPPTPTGSSSSAADRCCASRIRRSPAGPTCPEI